MQQLQQLQQGRSDAAKLFGALADAIFGKEYLRGSAGTNPHLNRSGQHPEVQEKFDAICSTVNRLRPNHGKDWIDVMNSHRSWLRKPETPAAAAAAAASSSSSTGTSAG